jgi:hypothetical protein
VRYILETNPAEPAELRGLLAQHVGRKTAEEIMTAAEMLRREGRQEGRQEGEARGQLLGKREVLLRLLRQRFGPVPAASVARIGKAGAVELDRWADRVLLAESLDAVLGIKARRKA